jgi:predicted transposase/invertase (TIGR01784 family)
MTLSKKYIDNNYQKAEELSTDLQKTREKKTDFLRMFKYEDSNNNFVLHVEAQSKDDPDMLYRMEEYHSMIRTKYKLPVVQIVLYLGNGISKMNNFYAFRKNAFHFDLINIQDFSYKTFINADSPEELMLTILSDFEDKSAEQIADLIFSRAKKMMNETNQRGKFVNQIEILSKLRNLDVIIQQYIQNTMALDLKIEDTFTYKKGKLEGTLEGEKKEKDKMIISLYKKGKLSIQDIADAAEVSVEYVEALIKEAEKANKK